MAKRKRTVNPALASIAPLGAPAAAPATVEDEGIELATFDAEAKARMREVERKINDDVAAQSETHYYVCVTFHSSEARREWLRKALGEEGDLRFVSGEDVAKACGVTIESPRPKLRDARLSRRLLDIAAPLGGVTLPRSGRRG